MDLVQEDLQREEDATRAWEEFAANTAADMKKQEAALDEELETRERIANEQTEKMNEAMLEVDKVRAEFGGFRRLAEMQEEERDREMTKRLDLKERLAKVAEEDAKNAEWQKKMISFAGSASGWFAIGAAGAAVGGAALASAPAAASAVAVGMQGAAAAVGIEGAAVAAGAALGGEAVVGVAAGCVGVPLGAGGGAAAAGWKLAEAKAKRHKGVQADDTWGGKLGELALAGADRAARFGENRMGSFLGQQLDEQFELQETPVEKEMRLKKVEDARRAEEERAEEAARKAEREKRNEAARRGEEGEKRRKEMDRGCSIS